MKKIINYLNEAIKKERWVFIFCFILFITGLVFGSLFINFISKADKNELIDQLTLYINNSKQLSESVFGIKAFLADLLNNDIQLILIFILGVSIIGILFVILILFFKGFMLGTSLAIMIYKYSVKGIILAFLYIFPSYVINILIYILLCFFAVTSSKKVIKALMKKGSLDFKLFLGRYLLSLIVSIFLMIISSFLNTYLTPVLIKLFTYI